MCHTNNTSFVTYFHFQQSLMMQNLYKNVLQLALGHHQKHDQDVPYTFKDKTNYNEIKPYSLLLFANNLHFCILLPP